MMERVENIVVKGENAGYQHFVLFPQFFQKLCFPEVKNWDCLVKGLGSLTELKILLGQNADLEHFLLFPHGFRKSSFIESWKHFENLTMPHVICFRLIHFCSFLPDLKILNYRSNCENLETTY